MGTQLWVSIQSNNTSSMDNNKLLCADKALYSILKVLFLKFFVQIVTSGVNGVNKYLI